MKAQRLFLLSAIILGLFGLIFGFISCSNPQQTASLSPTVVSVFPENNASAVDPSVRLSVTFSGDMDPASLSSSTFLLTSGEGNVAGVISYDSASKTAAFSPLIKLASATTYTATISDQVKDLQGNRMASPYSWYFTTVGLISAVGTPDASFGTNGIVIYDSGPLLPGTENDSDDYGNAAAIDDAGRILIAGSFKGDVLRYNANGESDNSFSGNLGWGYGLTSSWLRLWNALIIDQSGKILITGGSHDSSSDERRDNMTAVRLNTDGNTDGSFGDSGKFFYDTMLEKTSSNGKSEGRAITIDSAGRILVTGISSILTSNGAENLPTPCNMVWRINPDGKSLDSTFGDGGQIIAGGQAVIVDSGGAIIALGPTTIAKYDNNGKNLDNTFGNGGIVDYQRYYAGPKGLEPAPTSGNSMAVDPSGKILVAGYSLDYSSGTAVKQMTLWRFNADGGTDNGFGANGMVTDKNSEDGSANSAVIDSFGRILVVGKRWDGSYHDMVIWRYDSSGNLDSGFGKGGIVTSDVNSVLNRYPGDDSAGNSIVLDASGRIVVTGYITVPHGSDMVIWRYK
jgi:uncharacterized delta-60 repeat protein